MAATGGGTSSPPPRKGEKEKEEKERERERRLMCAICLEKFRRPKLLACFHTFCQSCVQAVAGPSPSFPCPACRSIIILPPGGVPALKSNHYLDIEEEEEDGRSTVRLCDVCAQDTEATHSCLQCQQRYCQPCRQFHDAISSCQAHTVVDLQAGSVADLKAGEGPRAAQEEEPCPKHRNQTLVLHCQPCRANICLQCKLTTHEGHPTQDLQDTRDEVKVRLQERLRQLSDQACTLQGVLAAISHRRSRLDTLHSATEQGIRDRALKVKEWVEDYQKITLDSLQALNEDLLMSLSGTEQGLQHKHAALRVQAEHISRVLKGNKDVDLVDLEANLTEVEVDPEQVAQVLRGLQSDQDPYTCGHNPVAMNMPCLQEFVGVLKKSEDKGTALGSEPEASGSSSGQMQCAAIPKPPQPAVCVTEMAYSRNPKSIVSGICTTSERRVWIRYEPSGEGSIMALFGKQGLVKEVTFAFGTGAMVTVQGDKTIGCDKYGYVHQWINTEGVTGEMQPDLPLCSTAKTCRQNLYLIDRSNCCCYFAIASDPSQWKRTALQQFPCDSLACLKDVSRCERYLAISGCDCLCLNMMVETDGLRLVSRYFPAPKKKSLDACFFPVGGREMLVVLVEGDNRVHVVDHKDGCHFVQYLDTGDLILENPCCLATDQETVLWVACKGGTVVMMEF